MNRPLWYQNVPLRRRRSPASSAWRRRACEAVTEIVSESTTEAPARRAPIARTGTTATSGDTPPRLERDNLPGAGGRPDGEEGGDERRGGHEVLEQVAGDDLE